MAYPYKKIESVFTHPNAKETFANIAKWCRMQDDTGSRRADGSSRSTSELAAVDPRLTFPQDQLKEAGEAGC